MTIYTDTGEEIWSIEDLEDFLNRLGVKAKLVWPKLTREEVEKILKDVEEVVEGI